MHWLICECQRVPWFFHSIRCVMLQCLFVYFRVEMASRKKKAAQQSADKVKNEDPYGGSTDENTDAEEEEDKHIPELPGLTPPAALLCKNSWGSLINHLCFRSFRFPKGEALLSLRQVPWQPKKTTSALHHRLQWVRRTLWNTYRFIKCNLCVFWPHVLDWILD